MAKSKMMKTVGAVVSGVLILGVADFLTARNFAPNPLYKKRGYTPPQQTEPELPPLDLSKLKISDTNKVLSQREALSKKAKLELKALTENDTMAMIEIGMMYQGTSLGEPDIAQTIYWYEKAAAAGDDNAAKLLPGLKLAQKFSGVIGAEQGGTQSLGEALAPAAKEMSDGITEANDEEWSKEKPSKVIEYLMGKNRDKEMLADTSMTDGEKRLLFTLMPVSRLKKIAKTGNITAQNQLGLKYFEDKKDAKNALYWFMEAAKGGHDSAVTNVAAILGSDQISEPNRDKAIAWMRAQADEGRTPAQLVIGEFYIGGQFGFPEEKTIGYAWIEKAAQKGHAKAQFEFGFAKMLGSDLPEDKANGIKWLKKSAAQGYSQGEYWLGDAYRYGDYVEKNHTEALKWFERAHNSEHNLGSLGMVSIYQDEDSLEQDDDKAREWVKIMIAEDGSSVGYRFAGDMYFEGRGYPQNFKLAFENYKMAAEKDSGDAQYKMAIMMLEGRGTQQNKELAIEWLKKADENYSYEAGEKLKELGIAIK